MRKNNSEPQEIAAVSFSCLAMALQLRKNYPPWPRGQVTTGWAKALLEKEFYFHHLKVVRIFSVRLPPALAGEKKKTVSQTLAELLPIKKDPEKDFLGRQFRMIATPEENGLPKEKAEIRWIPAFSRPKN